MGKPSIFSKEYERKMRKRKVRITILVIILVITAIALFSKNYITNTIKELSNKNSEAKTSNENKTGSDKNNNIKDDKEKSSEQDKENDTSQDKNESNQEEKFYEIKLGNGNIIKAIYEEKDGNKVFKYLAPTEEKVYFNLMPSGKGIIVYEEATQNIFLCDENGNSKEISPTKYTSVSTGKVFTKESTLKNKPTFVWSAYPKFCSDTQIVYVSQLPWFRENEKYLWKYDFKSETHKNLNIKGKDITIGNLTDKGLEINIDGNLNYLKEDGTLSQ